MNNRKRRKNKLERSIRYNNREIWNLYSTLSRVILAGLTQFKRAERHGYPDGFNPDEWEAKLNEMIWVFNECDKDFPHDPYTIWFNRECERFTKEHPCEKTHDLIFNEDGVTCRVVRNIPDTPKEILEEQDKYNKRVKDGLKLFAENFLHLWD